MRVPKEKIFMYQQASLRMIEDVIKIVEKVKIADAGYQTKEDVPHDKLRKIKEDASQSIPDIIQETCVLTIDDIYVKGRADKIFVTNSIEELDKELCDLK